MSGDRNQEKPSPILMLAPIGIVLLGYHYLFHSELSAEVAERSRQETVLQSRTKNFQREQSTLLGQLNQAKNELAAAEQQTKLAEAEVAEAEADKASLRAFLEGGTSAQSDMRVSQTPESLAGQLATMLTSTVSTAPGSSETPDGQDRGTGKASQMSSLCSILDAHSLRRWENTDPPVGSSSLVNSERTKLGKLLGTELPPTSRFQIQLEGSLTNLIAALHDLDDRLPSVSVVSVSLDPVDVQVRRYVWRLEVQIRG